jgi:enoyl-CoA hydratase/carnithine racemase
MNGATLGQRANLFLIDKIAYSTLSRQEKANAMDRLAVEELTGFFRQTDSDKNLRPMAI